MGIDDAAVRTILRAWRVGSAEVRSIRHSFNTVAHVVVGRRELAVRVAPAVGVHPIGNGEAERLLLAHLSAAGVRVPHVHPAPDGSATATVELPDGPRACMLLDWLPGREVARPVPHEDAAALGRLSARLHRHAPESTHLPPGVLDGRRVLTFHVPDHLDEAGAGAPLLRAARAAAQQVLDELWSAAPAPARLLHGDLTPANVVRSPDGVVVPIDFQDAVWAPPAVDLAITLVRLARDDLADGGSRQAAFRSGYESVAPWPPDTGWEPHLMAARSVNLANLTLALRGPGFAETLEVHLRALAPYVERFA